MAGRFVSEKSLQEAQERRKQEWADTYERLGQKPPEELSDEKYDPRPLYEKLREQKDKKQEDFEERIKFKNQFRGIDDEEAAYLADVSAERMTAEQARQEEIDQELAAFRERKMTRTSENQQPEASSSQSPLSSTSTRAASSAPAAGPPGGNKTKKKEKKGLKGIVVKKKSATEPSKESNGEQAATGQKRKESASEGGSGRDANAGQNKIEDSSSKKPRTEAEGS